MNPNNEWKGVSGIYKITCTANNKVYVGSSVNIYKRLIYHRNALRNNRHHCVHLQRCFNLYGETSFVLDVLEICKFEYFPIAEVAWIDRVFADGLLLNSTRDYRGTRGVVFSEETRQKISKANKGKVAYNKGKPMNSSQIDLLRKIRQNKAGKLIDVYDIKGNFIETALGICETARKYGFDKRELQRNLKGKYCNISLYIICNH
jgi:group I intron endonuclease